MNMSETARRYELPELTSRKAPPTAQQLEDVHACAYAEGWQKGHAEGYASGQAALQSAIAKVDALAESLRAPLAAADEAVCEQLRGMAVRLAEQLARHTLVASPEAVAGLVASALDMLKDGEGSAHVALHPQDRAGLPAELDLPVTVKWHDDPDLVRGDVRVWRGAAGIEGRLHERVALLAEQWLDGHGE